MFHSNNDDPKHNFSKKVSHCLTYQTCKFVLLYNEKKNH